ncbi:UvrD-helicase domain-containing protein [Agrobacterium sp. lyk4-40-TYG-31]|uniref:UvrD-helicase domain-containing protein n=1 Tax=Agrobacterium sp. lyk4-40-TYG-31 TaxID=3040276 RepID=UPI00254AA5BF|nr:UvrD-helicase domain-containing protein [Agrobacterium sp. lyk4-40-TYG-31]
MIKTGLAEIRLPILEAQAYKVRQGLIWTKLVIHPLCSDERTLGGLPRKQGRLLRKTIDAYVAHAALMSDLSVLDDFDRRLSLSEVEKLGFEEKARSEFRWLTHEMALASANGLPVSDIETVERLLAKPEVREALGTKAVSLIDRLKSLSLETIKQDWRQRNFDHVERELIECRSLFENVESRPLTEEQARAVICFENRIQVVASAGSGKTSTMVAKAAYALQRKLVEPKNIVMLAFNKQAAEELAERASRSFARLGMGDVSVDALTFHALGLKIVGKATGRKPDIPDWAIDAAGGIKKLMTIVDDLKDRSPTFRVKWDIFRLVFRNDLKVSGANGVADTWDEKGRGRVQTLDGKTVRSREKALIADWLFYNGVNYAYEQQYEIDTVDALHRQYRPDFYYPDIGLYHEHFALDAQGNAPEHFGDYIAGVEWKRELHETKGTALIETTSHQIKQDLVFEHLSKELTARGIELDPNPDRPLPDEGARPLAPEELTTLVRTFISHAKSNGLTKDQLYEKVESLPRDVFKLRFRMFLDIALPILQEWDAALAAEESIDFEDMLNLAAEHLENGTHDEHYELVMADEFQDASKARSRLCRALVAKPNRTFFAVGDDWQSINRFAGADVSVSSGAVRYIEPICR